MTCMIRKQANANKAKVHEDQAARLFCVWVHTRQFGVQVRMRCLSPAAIADWQSRQHGNLASTLAYTSMPILEPADFMSTTTPSSAKLLQQRPISFRGSVPPPKKQIACLTTQLPPASCPTHGPRKCGQKRRRRSAYFDLHECQKTPRNNDGHSLQPCKSLHCAT